MGNGFEGDTYGGAATNIETEIERRIEMKRQRGGIVFSQFSISRRQPSRFNCCKPSILIRTKTIFLFLLIVAVVVVACVLSVFNSQQMFSISLISIVALRKLSITMPGETRKRERGRVLNRLPRTMGQIV